MGKNPVRSIAISCDSRSSNQNPDCPPPSSIIQQQPSSRVYYSIHFTFFLPDAQKVHNKVRCRINHTNDAMAAIASVTNSGRVPLVVVDVEPIAVGTREIPRALDRKLMTDWPSGNSQPTPLAAIVPLCCCCCGGHWTEIDSCSPRCGGHFCGANSLSLPHWRWPPD